MAKSKEELVRILKSNIKAFNKYRDDTNNESLDLSDADLTGTNLCRVNLENVILKNAELNFAYLHSANLKNSDLSNLTVGRADMTETDLSDSKMDSTDLTNTILYGANLSRIKGHHLILEGAKVREVNFSGADLTNANLSNVDLNGVNFEKATLIGTDFTGSNLSNAIHLNTTKFDETTIWPESQSLPDNFSPKTSCIEGKHDFQNIVFDDDDSGFNLDYGPGVSTDPPDYEFLDGPLAPKEDKMVGGTTEFSSPFDTTQDETITDNYEELPNFEQFTFEDTPDFKTEPGLTTEKPSLAEEFLPEQGLMLEPGLAMEEIGMFDELEELEDADGFSSDFTESFESLSSGKIETPKIGSISDQKFPINNTTKEEKPATGPIRENPLDTTIKRQEPPSKQEPTPILQEVQTAINTEQMDALMAVLNNITNKLDNIEKEQTQQKKSIEELKKSQQLQNTTPPSTTGQEVLATQIEDLSSSTKNLFSRMESKIDIIVQTDPLDQLDSLLGELADSIQEEQGNLETKLESKITEISSSLDAIISMIDKEDPTTQENIDFTELINNTHQMLINLESNIKEDQEKADQKIEDLATIIDGMSIVLENLPSDTNEKLSTYASDTNEKIDLISAILESSEEKTSQLSAQIDSVSSNANNINSSIADLKDTINNVNNTVGTIIELSQLNQEDNAESQIYEAFYDFEFRLQLELEKNQNKLTNLENLFQKTNENIEKVSEHSTRFSDFSLEKLNNIPLLLNSIKDELTTEIEQTEQHTTALKNTIDDMIIQLESVFSVQVEGLQRYVGKELAEINNKIDHIMLDSKPKIDIDLNNKVDSLLKIDIELNDRVDSLLQIDSETQINLNNLGINVESILNSNNQLGAIISNINNKISALGQGLTAIDDKVNAARQDAKIDDETRAVFEHILLQINESGNAYKKSNETLTKKVDDMELDLQMTLKDMDRRINKINSMIRNVYKALDSITDLITESSRSSLSINKPRPKLHKDEEDS